MRRADTDELRGIILAAEPRPNLLLGAGASVTSGVPLVRDLIDMMGRQAYCWANGRSFRDATLLRSDWLPWVQTKPWYTTELDAAELYGLHIQNLLNPRERRRRFFQDHVLVGPQQASSGYHALASLVGKRRIHTILTTNFDTLAYDSCRQDPTASGVVQIQSPDHADLVSTDPAIAQVIHAHGVVDHYTDLNLTAEVAKIDERYATALTPLVGDHPLIVVGYRGAEPSIMRDLLIAAASAGRAALPHGIYWCHRERDGSLHPLVEELAELCGSNFATVAIEGFDELFIRLDEGTERSPDSGGRVDAVAQGGEASGIECSPGVTVDTRLVNETLTAQALERLALFVSEEGADGALARLNQLGLVIEAEGRLELTHAGNLLFGLGSPVRAVGHANGQAFEVAGNLFHLYEALTDIVAEANEPYRLKGPESIEVRAYPPLAIKELIVNALGHRSFESDDPIELSITPSRLRITNPGGLGDIANEATLGELPYKDYRNPVIAEVLYTAGLMDKHGSGLVDVRRWANEGGASATFEIGGDNTTFTSTLTSRPDSRSGAKVVEVGGSYEVFYLNALEVAVPEDLWIGPTSARKHKDVYDAHDGVRVAPFVFNGPTLLSFSDLSDPTNPLTEHVESPERHNVEEFCGDPAMERKVVELLNVALERHLNVDGTQLFRKKKRVWFHADPDGADRTFRYRARARMAERTVTRGKNTGQKFAYFEHQAMEWAFMRTNAGWVLTIEPTWVFTQDGEWKFVGRRRSGRLATKKMGNERNRAVLNHVFFWAWVICGDEDTATLDDGDGSIAVSRAPLVRRDAGAPPTIGSGDDDEADPDDLEDLEEDDEDVDDEYDEEDRVGEDDDDDVKEVEEDAV